MSDLAFSSRVWLAKFSGVRLDAASCLGNVCCLSPVHCGLAVSVTPSQHPILDMYGRYSPELGDVVVGRVVEVQTRRWAIEMGAQTHTALQLSAVQLPGGAQRRRTADDELNMRQLFQEGDLIVAEVRPCSQPRVH